MVLAQARMETRLLLRNGEQLLLAVVIPLIVLVGGVAGGRPLRPAPSPTAPVDTLTPGVLALAVMSTASPRWPSPPASSAATACSSGSAPRRSRAPGLLAGKVGALLLVEVLQVVGDLRGRRCCSAGRRRSTPVACSARCSARCSGTAAFASLGLFLAGALRAEATLAAANLVYLLLMAGGAVVLPPRRTAPFGDVAALLPSGALGDGLRQPLHRRAAPPGTGCSCWPAGPPSAPLLTARTFTWE